MSKNKQRSQLHNFAEWPLYMTAAPRTTDLVHHSPLHLDKGRSVRGPEASLSHSVQSVSSLLRPAGQTARGQAGLIFSATIPLKLGTVE